MIEVVDLFQSLRSRIGLSSGFIRSLSFFGGSQILIQGIGFFSGILIVRLLPVEQYALYTLANSILASMSVISDGGVSSAVMAEGGKVWQDRKKLGEVIGTGLELRERFGILAGLIGTPFLIWSLKTHGATILQIILITFSVLLSFSIALSGNILTIPLSLNQRLKELSIINLLQAFIRLLSLLGSLLILPLASVAMISTGFTQLWTNIRLRKIGASYYNKSTTNNSRIRQKILSFATRTIPGCIFFAISGQITIWLMSIFGSTKGVASLGALERLGQLLTIMSPVISGIIIPRFARMPENRSKVLIKYIMTLSIVCLFGVVMTVITATTPFIIPLILGKQYENLHMESVLVVACGIVWQMQGMAQGMGYSRGLIVPPWLIIILSLLIEITLILLLDMSKLINVIALGIALGSVGLVINVIYALAKIE